MVYDGDGAGDAGCVLKLTPQSQYGISFPGGGRKGSGF